MKVAIQGHFFRGKEVIQVLENLGGKNYAHLAGNSNNYYYINNDLNGVIQCHSQAYVDKYCKKYTLEEFKKEFPFKVGDLCIYYSGFLGTEIDVKILGMAIRNDCIMYEVGHKDTTETHSGIYKRRHTLKSYKEMKEKRNITLTLSKAREWHRKGGELKEVALIAYSEEELTKIELPESWEEFCDNYMIDDSEAYFDNCCTIFPADASCRNSLYDRNICPSKKSANAHLALMQLEQLRDCWRQGWKPTKYDTGYCIVHYPEEYIILAFSFISFLSFPAKKMAEEFLECFRDLIEQAGDLI